ncbi:MAG: PH domain-containing protein [Planctomycetes bacterium]|nr:PH domain-containing protein [Planctomycetota bacterium]
MTARVARNRVLQSSEIEALSPDRAAALLPESLIQDDEVVILLLRPSLLYIPLACANTVVFVALLTFLAAYLSRWQSWVPWTDTQAFMLGVALAAIRLGWQTLEWYSRIYVLTDRRLIRRLGVLRVSIFQTQLSAIQHTSVFSRVRERLFGLGTIGFATAGSDVFEAFWVMLRRPFAVHKVVVEAIERYGGTKGPRS